MTDHHSHLHRLVESREDDMHLDPVAHFQTLAGARATLPTLAEANGARAEGEHGKGGSVEDSSEAGDMEEALGVPDLDKWKMSQKGGTTFHTIKLHGKTVTVSETPAPKGSGLYRWRTFINGKRVGTQDDTQRNYAMRTVEKAVMKGESVEDASDLDEAGMLGKLGKPVKEVKVGVVTICVYKSKSPHSKFSSVIKGKGGKELPGASGDTPDEVVAKTKALMKKAGGKVESVEYQGSGDPQPIADGSILVTEDVERFRVLVGLVPLPPRR